MGRGKRGGEIGKRTQEGKEWERRIENMMRGGRGGRKGD